MSSLLSAEVEYGRGTAAKMRMNVAQPMHLPEKKTAIMNLV
jgi:hypothetical protein